MKVMKSENGNLHVSSNGYSFTLVKMKGETKAKIKKRIAAKVAGLEARDAETVADPVLTDVTAMYL